MPKKLSVQKRKEILKKQLYGKEVIATPSDRDARRDAPEVTYSVDTLKPETPVRNVNYSFLKKDLIKIFLLSVIAFGSQILLFWALNNNLVNLPWVN
jgi:hypothetical protein